MEILSISRTGVTSQAVPVKKTSLAAYSMSRVKACSTTSIRFSRARVMTESRVIAVRMGWTARGVQAAPVDHENVLACAFGHSPGGVQHDGLVVAQAHHLALGQHGIHVLTGDLGLAHGVVEVTTHEGGQVARMPLLRASAPR